MNLDWDTIVAITNEITFKYSEEGEDTHQLEELLEALEQEIDYRT